MRDPCQKTVTLEEVTHTDPVVEKIDIQVEETVEERVEQDTIQVTGSEHEPIEERVEQDATQVTSSKQDKSGTMRYCLSCLPNVMYSNFKRQYSYSSSNQLLNKRSN